MNRYHQKPLSIAIGDALKAIGLAHTRQRSRAYLLSGGLAMGLALGTGLAHAADASTPAGAAAPDAASGATAKSAKTAAAATPATAGSNVTQLDTVTVTADKRVERSIDVPMSVSSVSGKTLVEQHKTKLLDYLQGTPGVQVLSSGNTNEISMRGITTGGSGNPVVGVTIDDVPASSSTSSANGGELVPDLDPSDIKDIEVLLGPQGTLYGAASLGGLLKYTMVDPDTTKLSGQAQVDGSSVAHGGSGNTERVSLNVPVVKDTFAFRISAFNREDPGYIQNASDDDSKGSTHAQGGRLSAIWFVNDRITVRSSAQFQQSNTFGTQTEDVDAAGQPLYGNYTQSRIPGAEHSSFNYSIFTTSITDDLGWSNLVSTTGFSNSRYSRSTDMSPAFGWLASLVGLNGYGAELADHTQTRKFTQELRLESPQDGRKLDWRIGAFYTNEQSSVDQVINFADSKTGAWLPDGEIESALLDSRYREYAGFGSVTYHFTPRFDVQAGVRYSRNDQSYAESGDAAYQGTSSDSSFSYMISPRYHLTNDWMVYARVANGYRPGGPNEVPSSASEVPKTYGPDKTIDFELGTKGEFLDKRLALDLSVYHIKWSNIQLQAVDSASAYSYYVNSGGAKSDGFEAALTARPWPGMTVHAGVAYTRAVLTADAPDAIYGRTGDSLPNSAKWTANLSARQAYSLGDGFKGFSSATLTYLGARQFDFSPDASIQRLHAGAFATVDLATGVSRNKWSVVAYIRNIGDRRGVVQMVNLDQVNYSGPYGATLITPRTFGVTLTTAF
ncbi:TonB-dependent receptor [Paraburkholderia sp.]|uniref:TonB-dependent receptor n=1 Tax=Paraburkholderia sp. TaxID=1926495 RepID=UPI0023A0CE08|nr:TonB-dependent receptor [Paraburkholderia sp.]MDE1181874.1 TonB-dependent receptor [Paraburkholderia sp.]